jgi:hypothetical protein
MPETTVSGILTRTGLGRLGRIGLEPPRRYERSRPGELIHIDIKKLGWIGQACRRALGRGPGRHKGKGKLGWEFVHVCVDDATRLGCRALGVRHLRTRPYRPQTCGKVCVLASRCRPPGRRGSPRLRA